MTIDERIEALTMNLELASRDIQDLKDSIHDLKTIAQQDGENIRALARIAEIHERRLTDLEGGE
jgi:archaellum component FlaC